MSDDLPAIIERCYRAAVTRVHAGAAVSRHLRRDGNRIVVDGRRYVTDAGAYVIAIGKAAPEMMSDAEDALGDAFTAGIVVTKVAPERFTGRARILVGAHPTPDERSLAAGRAVLAFARAVPSGALALCLISGGGSALVEVPAAGVSLSELQRVTAALLRAGASIHELNAVRARLSDIKAGGLLDALRRAAVANLIVSDVLGDDLGVIASGPTVPAEHTLDAEEVLARYGVRCQLPARRARPSDARPQSVIVANVSAAIDAAAQAARASGYAPCVLSRSLTGEARTVAETLASIVADSAVGRTSLRPPLALLAGGETTVTVRGDGHGGRNTEGALAAALRLAGTPVVAMGFLATDGDDANTGAAGAIVTGSTLTHGQRAAARDALARNDSFTFLDDHGAIVRTGPTGTNVNDLVIALIGRPPVL